MSDNVPLSSGELEAAWNKLCAFELDGQAWSPTATLLAAAWKSMISAATANSLDLKQSFEIQVLSDLVREEGHPVPLIEAIVRKLRSQGNDDLMDGCK